MLAKYKGVDPKDPSLISQEQREIDLTKSELYKNYQGTVAGELITTLLKEDQKTLSIPFRYCSRLIKDYKVELHNGYALVKPDDSIIIIQELFNTIMFLHNKEITGIYEQLYNFDPRIRSLVDLLQEYNTKLKSEIVNEKVTFSFNIKLENLD